MNLTLSEVVDQIGRQRKREQYFIKAKESGNDFVDIDLIERFIARPLTGSAFESFELLDMEQIWRTLIELDPDKLARVKRADGEVIEWTWTDSHGIEKKTVYPFTPEGIMKIIDDEFFA
jgi:hypothetical protein